MRFSSGFGMAAASSASMSVKACCMAGSIDARKLSLKCMRLMSSVRSSESTRQRYCRYRFQSSAASITRPLLHFVGARFTVNVLRERHCRAPTFRLYLSEIFGLAFRLLNLLLRRANNIFHREAEMFLHVLYRRLLSDTVHPNAVSGCSPISRP